MSESALPTEQIETPKPVPHPAKEASSSGRLPLLIFIATLLGSLLGVLADASELTGSNLLEPVVKLFDPSPALHIAGSNTILGKELGMMSDWQAGFEALTGWENHIPLLGTLERKVQIEVSAVGTTAGFIETLQGKVNLFAASEPLKPEQQQALKEAGLEIQCAAVIGYDVIAFVTNFNNKVPEISTRQMTSILNDGYQGAFAAGRKPSDTDVPECSLCPPRYGANDAEAGVVRVCSRILGLNCAANGQSVRSGSNQ